MTDPHQLAASPLERRGRLVAGLLLLLAAVAFYWPPADCQFVFDDKMMVTKNPAVLSQSPLGALFDRHQLLGNRPLTSCWAVLQHLAFAGSPWGFRWCSLLLHLANIALLFQVVRTTLQAPNLGARFQAARASWTAFAVAAAWGLHPLAVECVAYVSQQSMLLITLFALLAVRSMQRAIAMPERRSAAVLTVMFTALGMATKEEMAAAPLLLVLYARAFLLPSWTAMRAHIGLWLALGCTWIVLAYCIASGPRNTSVGWDIPPGVRPHEWLMTQAEVLLLYLRLCLWPHPLKAAYDHGIQRDLVAALPAVLAVASLFATAVWLSWRRPAWGFLGALFFLQLAPTSSILPIVTEVVAERRMYLPMLTVLVPLVLLAGGALARIGGGAGRTAIAGALAVVLGLPAWFVTRTQLAVYTTDAHLWDHAFATNELSNGSITSAMIFMGRARMLREQGKLDEALAMYDRAVQSPGAPPEARHDWALVQEQRGNLASAESTLRELVRDHAYYDEPSASLAALLWRGYMQNRTGKDDPRLVEAEQLARKATVARAQPEWVNTLAVVLIQRHKLPEAVAALQHAIQAAPGYQASYRNLAGALLTLGQPVEAIAVCEGAIARFPEDATLRLNLAAAQHKLGRAAAARTTLLDLLQRQPENAQARALLERIDRGQ